MNTLIKSAAVAFAFTASAAFAQTTATQEVVGNVGDAISINAESASTPITLAPGANNSVPNSLTVSATKAFTITAKTDLATMAQHDGEAYVEGGEALFHAPTIAATSNGQNFEGTAVGPQTLTTTGAPIFNGDEAVQNGSVLTTVAQQVNYTDKVLTAEGHKYRVVVTYTASLNAN